jgi:excisionase family DNA binding protein
MMTTDTKKEKAISPKSRVITPELVTDILAAQMLSVSRTTIWNLVTKGVLKPIHVNSRTTRFRYSEVKAFSETGMKR